MRKVWTGNEAGMNWNEAEGAVSSRYICGLGIRLIQWVWASLHALLQVFFPRLCLAAQNIVGRRGSVI